MTNIDSILKKQRNHFVDKGPYSQNYVCFFFSSPPVIMYGCERMKKAEH